MPRILEKTLDIQKSQDKPWTLVHGKTQRLFDYSFLECLFPKLTMYFNIYFSKEHLIEDDFLGTIAFLRRSERLAEKADLSDLPKYWLEVKKELIKNMQC